MKKISLVFIVTLICVLTCFPQEDILEGIKDAKEKIVIGNRDGGYILSTACSIAPHTPSSHVHMLREAAHQKNNR